VMNSYVIIKINLVHKKTPLVGCNFQQRGSV